MSDDTKEKAMAKIATFNPKIGYPDKWKDYSHVTIRRDAFFENTIAGRKFVEEDDRATIGKPVDRGRWGMTPPTSDAYYNPLLNEIVFPAGILQPPAFDVNAVDAVNYGAIGVVIGHEISHGFDDEGAQFDYLGRLRNWWTEADLNDFKKNAPPALPINSTTITSRKISTTTANWCSAKALAIWAAPRSLISPTSSR
jgi:endothelin-converting enzyme/putative endopeptidase